MQFITDIFLSIRILDILDIMIVAIVLYHLLLMIRGTRAEQLIKGLVILLIILKVSEWAQMHVVHFILKNTLTLGFIALVIVFQPELRRALEYIGRHKIIGSGVTHKQRIIDSIHQIVNACEILSRDKIGALIVLERETGLGEIVSTGVEINGDVSAGLLINIFIPNTPLHDGAVVLQKGVIAAASCLLPLSDNVNISKDVGTRHRAAVGICEQSDAVVVVVSEETGSISLAMDGKLSRFLDMQTLENILKDEMNVSASTSILNKKWRKKDV